MTAITVYDPAMCCATGLCGVDVDQRLVDLAADLDWLKAQGVSVLRFGLSREPAEFVANDVIRRIMQDSEGDDLPAFLVDGALVAKARYPGRVELAEWAGVAAPTPEIAAQVREVVGVGRRDEEASAGSLCERAEEPAPEAAPEAACCGGAAKSAPAAEKAGGRR